MFRGSSRADLQSLRKKATPWPKLLPRRNARERQGVAPQHPEEVLGPPGTSRLTLFRVYGFRARKGFDALACCLAP